MSKQPDFALIGAAGFIAPRHMKAIKDSGGRLVAATDPHDSVGIIDSSFPEARFFTEIERLDRHLEKLRRRGEGVDYVSVCSPNYLHDAHVRLGLRLGASVICEKPLVISPWNLDQLEEIEAECPGRIHTVLQLRYLPAILELRQQLAEGGGERLDVDLTYITRRGAWYQSSWKGSEEKSGGVAMNIGVHFFDLLTWLFGCVQDSAMHLREASRMAGVLELERARVRWFLSVDGADLPDDVKAAQGYAFRSLKVGGEEIEFSTGFTDLHTKVYQEILAGRGYGIADARASIETVHRLRQQELTTPGPDAHPLLRG